MPQFFISAKQVQDGQCAIMGDDFHHLKNVRRVKLDDTLILRDDGGNSYLARITGIGADRIETIIEQKMIDRKAPVDITLCLCILKGKNFDLSVQKAVEVGVSHIIPVISERTVALPGNKEAAKIERWSKIVHGAAKQCMRSDVPEISRVRTFQEVLEYPQAGGKVIAHPGSVMSLKQYRQEIGEAQEVSLLVGPEGGFSVKEIEEAGRHGWQALEFGTTQLRAETAAIVIPAIILYEWERDHEDPS